MPSNDDTGLRAFEIEDRRGDVPDPKTKCYLPCWQLRTCALRAFGVGLCMFVAEIATSLFLGPRGAHSRVVLGGGLGHHGSDPKLNKLTFVLSRHGSKVSNAMPNVSLASYFGKRETEMLQGTQDGIHPHPILIDDPAQQDAMWEKMYGDAPATLSLASRMTERKIGEAFRQYYRNENTADSSVYAYTDVDKRDIQSCHEFVAGYSTAADRSAQGRKDQCVVASRSFLSEGAVLAGTCNGAKDENGKPFAPKEIDLDDYRGEGSDARIEVWRTRWDEEVLPLVDAVQRTINFQAAIQDSDEKIVKKFTDGFRVLNHDREFQKLPSDQQERDNFYASMDKQNAAWIGCVIAQHAMNEYVSGHLTSGMTNRITDVLKLDSQTLATWMKMCYWHWQWYSSSPHNAKVILAEYLVHLHASISKAIGRTVENQPHNVKHGKAKGMLLLYMAHDVNVGLLGSMLGTTPWPSSNLPSKQFPAGAVPYHCKIIVEVPSEDHVQLKLFAPTLEATRDGFYGYALQEGDNLFSLRFPCGENPVALSCPADIFLKYLAHLYRHSEIELGSSKQRARCISKGSEQYAAGMLSHEA